MTQSEESAVDAHILKASNLRDTSCGYKALKNLLSTGNLLCASLGEDYSVFVNFTRVLDHVRLEYQFINSGLELQKNAKLHYLQKVINCINHENKPIYKYENNRIGKEERTEYGGWIRTREEKK